METLSDWVEPYKKGVVYYLQEGRVRGVLLWNVYGNELMLPAPYLLPNPVHLASRN